MDITQIAADTANFLAPYLPYLIAGTKLAAKAAIEKAGGNFSDALWKKAEELWGRLKPKVESSPVAQKAIENASANQLAKAEGKADNITAQVKLEAMLETMLEADEDLRAFVEAEDYSIHIGGNVENANILSNSNNNQIISHIEHYYAGVPVSDAEKEKTQNAFRAHLEKLRRHCNALPLAALGGDDSDEDITLDKVYIELDTTQSREISKEEFRQHRKVDKSGVNFIDKHAPISVMDFAAENKRLVILGEAGAGKSTFVKKLIALQSAVLLGETKESIQGFAPDLVPVFIVLRDLSPKLAALDLGKLSAENQKQALSESILEKIREDIKSAEFIPLLEKSFESGKVLLVLDGLDEVPQALRERVRRAVGALTQLHQVERVIVTSRTRSYTGQAVFPNFQSCVIAPFDEEKISRFAQAWYNEQFHLGHLTAEHVEKRSDDLANAARGEDLIEMSSNPMMLTSIAIIHQKDIGLPRERVRLYRLIVEVLLSRWQKYKAGEESLAPSKALTEFLVEGKRLRAALELLAYETHRANYASGNNNEKNSEADLPRGQALTLLESGKYLGSTELASEFLDYVDQRSGLLVGKGGDLEKPTSYSFPHRTIQEYLAGCSLVSERNRGREYFKHAAEGDFWSLAALMGAEELYYNHDKTRDALLDLAYHLCPVSTPRNEQDERALLWSGQIACLFGNEEIKNDADNSASGKEYLDRLIARTVELLESKHLPPRERAEAGNTLAKLGDPRPGVLPHPALRATLSRGERVNINLLFCEIPAGKFLMGSREGEKDSLKSEYPQFEYPIPYNYFMSRYPITNAQFDLFVNDPKGYINNEWWTEAGLKWRKDRKEHNRYGGVFSLSNHPVVGVTWYEAAAFCKWLAKQHQVSGSRFQVYDSQTHSIREDENLKTLILAQKLEIRLPTEAEWERAARGSFALGAVEAHTYPWGNEITPNHANYSDTNLNATSAVGAFPLGMNDYGLLDMSGNVWEWCATEWQENYKEYLEKENNNPEGDVARVVRGGAYGNVDRILRCARRFRNNPSSYGSLKAFVWWRRRSYFLFHLILVPDFCFLVSEKVLKKFFGFLTLKDAQGL
ncbi:MAG: SUMF1/EgtB/PvdO family nonheme iron enzyme [Chloroflexi bacterium]|nr:SUMF1/EgtB/PvdO family nonheme iron enzyme [Chloroflexota bacterium]